jgi:hypothetical protein
MAMKHSCQALALVLVVASTAGAQTAATAATGSTDAGTYVGVYELTNGQVAVVVSEDEVLVARIGNVRMPLTAGADLTFSGVGPTGPFSLRFTREGGGAVTGLVARVGGETIAGRRTQTSVPSPPEEITIALDNPMPAFPRGEGPRTCLDAAHGNFQLPARNGGTYRAFTDLLVGDGYRMRELNDPFSAVSLADCDLLIVIHPLASDNLKDWAFPHPGALARGELEALYSWLRAGGGLFLISDHGPIGALTDVGSMLGVVMLDGNAFQRRPMQLPEVFSVTDGGLRDHAIVRGRNATERVDRIATFSGAAFLASLEWSPLMVFGAGAVGLVDLGYNFRGLPDAAWPHFSVGGWLLAASRRVESGRVVMLNEVGTCAARVVGPAHEPVGMNHPEAPQNAQFCLNVARWLSGLLGD